jgi:hypothetical protein
MGSILAIVVVCAGVAVASHLLIRRFVVLANLLAAIGSAVLIQVIVRVQVGHGDPFALLTIPLSMLIALAVAIPVGIVIDARRRRRESRRE